MAQIVRYSKMYNIVQKFRSLQTTNTLFLSKRNYSIVRKETKAWQRIMINSGFPKHSQVLQLLPHIVGTQKLCQNCSQRNFGSLKVLWRKIGGPWYTCMGNQ